MSEVRKLPVFEFDRYSGGELKAEGIRITKQRTLLAAISEATMLADRGDVLVLRATLPRPDCEGGRLLCHICNRPLDGPGWEYCSAAHGSTTLPRPDIAEVEKLAEAWAFAARNPYMHSSNIPSRDRAEAAEAKAKSAFLAALRRQRGGVG